MSSIQGFGGGYSTLVRQAAERREQGQASRITDRSRANESRFELVSRTRDPVGAQGIQADPTLGHEAGRSVDEILQKVSDYQNTADKMVIDLATGKDTNIHNTMVELEKADIALKYTVQLRNRALNAYEELMRIQV
ncbi:MAG: flagellar hook-basal body complex protein FliE [Myxococcota bacterium]|nr:flagellar hook-basal body complex protein FliE [Myxococcota bacterium]